MVGKRTVNEWKKVVAPALDSKVEELLQMGYSKVTHDKVWECLQTRIWKGNPDKRIHEVVQDIMHLNANKYMSFLTIESYQDNDLMASIAALTRE